MKSRNPGWKGGDHWMICDRCGFSYRASQMLQTWDGLWVCEADFETRHPQDFVRGRKDQIAAQPVRPEGSQDTFVADPGFQDVTGNPDYQVPLPNAGRSTTSTWTPDLTLPWYDAGPANNLAEPSGSGQGFNVYNLMGGGSNNWADDSRWPITQDEMRYGSLSLQPMFACQHFHCLQSTNIAQIDFMINSTHQWDWYVGLWYSNATTDFSNDWLDPTLGSGPTVGSWVQPHNDILYPMVGPVQNNTYLTQLVGTGMTAVTDSAYYNVSSYYIWRTFARELFEFTGLTGDSISDQFPHPATGGTTPAFDRDILFTTSFSIPGWQLTAGNRYMIGVWTYARPAGFDASTTYPTQTTSLLQYPAHKTVVGATIETNKLEGSGTHRTVTPKRYAYSDDGGETPNNTWYDNAWFYQNWTVLRNPSQPSAFTVGDVPVPGSYETSKFHHNPCMRIWSGTESVTVNDP